MKIVLDEGAVMPTRAHTYDAGLDLYTPVDVVVPETELRMVLDPTKLGYPRTETLVGSVTIDTGVHVKIPEGCVGFVKSKSGLMVNHGITTDCTIDCGYTGSIKVKLFNHTSQAYHFKAGDKIAQLVVVPCVLLPLEEVQSLGKTDRGANGFGSTGK